MHDIRISSEEFDALPKHGKIGQWGEWNGKTYCTSKFTVLYPTVAHNYVDEAHRVELVALADRVVGEYHGRT